MENVLKQEFLFMKAAVCQTKERMVRNVNLFGTNLSVVYVFSFTLRKWVTSYYSLSVISNKESHELKISLDVLLNIL